MYLLPLWSPFRHLHLLKDAVFRKFSLFLQSIRGRKATLEELQSVHTEKHVLLYGTNPLNRLKLDNRKLAGTLRFRRIDLYICIPNCGGTTLSSTFKWFSIEQEGLLLLSK